MSTSSAHPAELQEMMSRSAAVRSGDLSRDPIEDMQWALGTQPPDFLSLVSLVQRVGLPVLGVVEEQSRRTPLHIAALYAKVAYTAMLIARGAALEARDSSNWTPLMSAAFGETRSHNGGLSVAKLLLARGAEVNATCSLGTSCLHVAASYGSTLMAGLLLDNGAELDIRDHIGETPLHKSALRGDVNMVQFLVARGANVKQKTREGETAEDLAAREGMPEHDEVTRYLRTGEMP